MSRTNEPSGVVTKRPSDETFLQRFSRLKHEARQGSVDAAERAESPAGVPATAEPEAPNGRPADRDLLTDADMPDLETLDERSDYTGFLSAKVSESIRRAALRKLFHSTAFNVIDELDDYNEDFTTFEGLGEIVTAEMRHRAEMERRRELEREAREEADENAVADEPVETDDDEIQATASASNTAPESVDASIAAATDKEREEGMRDDGPSAPV